MAIAIGDFGNLSITLLFVIGVGIIFLIIAILYTVDYELRKKRALQESTLEYRYSLRFDELKKERIEPSEFIDKAEKLGRSFIEEKFGVNSGTDFSQLTETFNDKGKPYVIAFCQTMLEVLYSGKKPGVDDARAVLNSLEMMFRQEGVLIVIKKKEEPTEKTNMLTEFAKKIQKELSEKRMPEIKQNVEKANEISSENKTQAVKPEPAIDYETNKQALAPIPKKEMVMENKSGRKKDRKEYKYIESLDSLDRIRHRVQKHQEEKKQVVQDN